SPMRRKMVDQQVPQRAENNEGQDLLQEISVLVHASKNPARQRLGYFEVQSTTPMLQRFQEPLFWAVFGRKSWSVENTKTAPIKGSNTIPVADVEVLRPERGSQSTD